MCKVSFVEADARRLYLEEMLTYEESSIGMPAK